MSVEADQIEIISPCPITLDRSAVDAEDRSMFCAHCTTDVHLLSQMTESEARALMRAKAGRDICVSYATRSDGSIRFRPEPALVPVTSLRRRQTAAAQTSPPRRMSLVASIGASMLLAACAPHGDEEIAGGVEARPVVEQTSQPELVEEIPCDGPPMPVAGGIRAEPLPEEMVEGGIRAAPLPEPVEVKQPEIQEKIEKRPTQHRRGGIRARPVDRDDPLAEL